MPLQSEARSYVFSSIALSHSFCSDIVSLILELWNSHGGWAGEGQRWTTMVTTGFCFSRMSFYEASRGLLWIALVVFQSTRDAKNHQILEWTAWVSLKPWYTEQPTGLWKIGLTLPWAVSHSSVWNSHLLLRSWNRKSSTIINFPAGCIFKTRYQFSSSG